MNNNTTVTKKDLMSLFRHLFILSSTPSDYRASRNMVSLIAKTL